MAGQKEGWTHTILQIYIYMLFIWFIPFAVTYLKVQTSPQPAVLYVQQQ